MTPGSRAQGHLAGNRLPLGESFLCEMHTSYLDGLLNYKTRRSPIEYIALAVFNDEINEVTSFNQIVLKFELRGHSLLCRKFHFPLVTLLQLRVFVLYFKITL